MMIRKLVTARIALTLGFSLAVLACTDDVGGDGADETEGMEGTEDEETGDGDGDSGDGDSGDGDGDGDGGDTGDLEVIEQACADACEVVANCYFPVPQCTQWCMEAYTEVTAECVQVQLAITQCIAMLTCAEYEALVEGQPGTPCEAEALAAEACEG